MLSVDGSELVGGGGVVVVVDGGLGGGCGCLSSIQKQKENPFSVD